MISTCRRVRQPAASISVLILLLCAGAQQAADDDGYLGIRVADNAAGQLVVSWFFPGPFDGAGLTSSQFDIARPDVIVAVDGESMNAERFNAYIRSRAPGTEVTIEYKVAAQRRTSNIPSKVETRDELKSITVSVDTRASYTGTIGQPRTIGRTIEFDGTPLLDPFDEQNVLGAAVAANDLTKPLQRLLDVFEQYDRDAPDTHMLPHVRAGFQHPFRLLELQESLDVRSAQSRFAQESPNVTLAKNPVQFARVYIGQVLDLQGVGGSIGLGGDLTHPETDAAQYLRSAIGFSDTWINWALGKEDGSGDQLLWDESFARQCIELLRVPRRSFYIAGADAKQHISVIRRSLAVDWRPMGNLLLEYQRETPEIDVDALKNMPLVDPPAALEGIVKGRIIEAFESRTAGWIIIGGTGPNRYDMAKVSAVYDLGGNDAYDASGLRLGSRAIIDLAGNDTYTGTPDQGPGGAIFGCSIIDDRAGNDTYEGQMLSCGAAIYGVSLLLDRGGNDRYRGSDWSMGAGVYGAGMLIDLGNGNDVYEGEFLCQGVGGPRGLGALIDEGGRDLYRANGPHPSAYGTPAVYQSFSQGVGFGYRNYAAGGIGLLSDLGGDDRYEAGEFSQGGAYYYALGILHDGSGRDLYYGNRYGQGFGVHQAHGVLADDAGDDTYWSMTAASQGAAWDIGAGLLIDRGGNDSYQADGLAQGGASMQAIAMLIDLDGVDRYSAGGGATQGQSGGDSYHFDATGAFSFSLLFDRGGAVDFYSRNRANDAVTKTGSVREKNPENSSAWGLVIDE